MRKGCINIFSLILGTTISSIALAHSGPLDFNGVYGGIEGGIIQQTMKLDNSTAAESAVSLVVNSDFDVNEIKPLAGII